MFIPLLYTLLLIAKFIGAIPTIDVENTEDGVEISQDTEDLNSASNSHEPSDLKKFKRDTDALLKGYIDKLKNGQEITLTSGTGYKGSNRFKKGKIHIKKESSFKKSPEITESTEPKYSYPFGLGMFLMSGCFRYMQQTPKPYGQRGYSNDYDYQDSGYRRKRSARQSMSKNSTKIADMESFCKRYAKQERTLECRRMIPGAYTLGTGFDIKYQSGENSRRKSVVARNCNYQKYFEDYTVPDTITANGIYDTKTQSMTFGQSSDYMKFIASKSNLDRYSNVFKEDMKNVYGGLEGQHSKPGNDGRSEDQVKLNKKGERSDKSQANSDFYLYQIQSTILIYELILDQINSWNLDPEFLVDFLFLPESYFYSDAPTKFNRFIQRYGTHVVISAKFGGEFKIMNTMQKTKTSSIESFSEKCTQDSMKMFSRTVSDKTNLLIFSNTIKKMSEDNKNEHTDTYKNSKDIKAHANQYASTYLSVKGGTQEVAAIVANLGQPDFADSFIGWLESVHKYPRAFDLKYEPLVSILDINVKSLFAQAANTEQRVCFDSMKKTCYFGFTMDEFEESWHRKLRALQFAITVYLKEPDGLSLNKFFIKKGDSDCRFNILNYLSPYWSEITSGAQEFHLTFNFIQDEVILANSSRLTNQSTSNEFTFKMKDEIYFLKREDLWLAKRKGNIYTYESARLLPEPLMQDGMAAANRSLLNIFGLVLEYKETDATVSVVDLEPMVDEYIHNKLQCPFSMSDLRRVLLGFETVFLRAMETTIEKEAKFASLSSECQRQMKILLMTLKHVKNVMSSFWLGLKGQVIGVVDYVNPIKSVVRAWDLKFAVLPCQLKWSNNLMMVLPKDEGDDKGKCLRFTAATETEFFLVTASTPSDQNSWYIFQVTTKGVIFYRAGLALLLNEDSSAGTTGDANIYQNFFLCLNYEWRRVNGGSLTRGLYIQYGIQVNSDEISHLYLSYFDTAPLDPIYYSFGSRSSDVTILNARLEDLSEREQINLRCDLTSTLNKATQATKECDYKCHEKCMGCTKPRSVHHCKACKFAKLLFNNNNSSTSVVNERQQFLCVGQCPAGFRADPEQGNLCVDVDECKTSGASDCQKSTVCVNLVGSYKCDCQEGFEGNGIFCQDVDECALATHNCSSKSQCINSPGAYRCKCLPGFRGDGSSCVDIDECAESIHDCQWSMMCHNTIGSFSCFCPTGFQLVKSECIDVNECTASNYTCSEKNAICQNTLGSYTCVCSDGFRMYNGLCQDINECHSEENTCDQATQKCINSQGSYYCECHQGLLSYTHNGQVYCTESLAPILATSASVLSSLECLKGFYWAASGACIDINECHLSLHDCGSDAACVNTHGSFYCKCPEGFDMDERSRCRDINECELTDFYGCSSLPGQVCVNTIGSFYCQCELELASEGYGEGDCVLSELENDGINTSCRMVDDVLVCDCAEGFEFKASNQICEDINECEQNGLICSANAKCINQYGSYTCECLTGFIANYATIEGFKCEDYDECSSQCEHDCDPELAHCINLPGSFDCACRPGFNGTGRVGHCQDIDECSDLSHDCGPNSLCVNEKGSFECQCVHGFSKNDSRCEDINECVDLGVESECRHKNAICVNTVGFYHCQCLDGFRLNNVTRACEDVNECSENPISCDGNLVCLNLVGSFACGCSTGFKWSHSHQMCEDVNECEDDVNDPGGHMVYSMTGSVCDENAICINTAGSYMCQCKDGWNRTSTSDYCSDLNECKGESACSTNATCHNLPGSYECHCLPGFSLENGNCLDINECTTTKNICGDAYHQCINSIGSYSCQCVTGFATDMNGLCIDLDECEQDHSSCGKNTVCTNLLGSFRCECLTGFEKLPHEDNECYDINECSEDEVSVMNKCHRYATCLNTYGSYNCTCQSGFVGDGLDCADIDECSSNYSTTPGQSLCNNTGACVNTVGFYRCDCFDGYVPAEDSPVCVDLDECDYESCFSNMPAGASNETDVCYAFGLCRNMLGSFVCECFDGFEYDHENKYCRDIDECRKLSVLGISSSCQRDYAHMESCQNTCGGYKCSCQDSLTTVVDIYDHTRCYLKKHVRELVLYFDFVHHRQRQKGSFGIVSQNLNITVDSCANNNSNNKSISSHFELKLNSVEESATYSESWLPVYTDNENWAHIEFICRIHIDYLMLLEGQPNRGFQLVMLEDRKRGLCSLFRQAEKKVSEHFRHKINYAIDSVWILDDLAETCETALDKVTVETMGKQKSVLNYILKNGEILK